MPYRKTDYIVEEVEVKSWKPYIWSFWGILGFLVYLPALMLNPYIMFWPAMKNLDKFLGSTWNFIYSIFTILLTIIIFYIGTWPSLIGFPIGHSIVWLILYAVLKDETLWHPFVRFHTVYDKRLVPPPVECIRVWKIHSDGTKDL